MRKDMMRRGNGPKKPERAAAAAASKRHTYQMGEYSLLRELGMQLWADDGPTAGGRLAAVNCGSDNGRSPHPAGWNWVAKALEFIAPSPLARSICRSAPVSSSTIASARKLREAHARDLSAPVPPTDTRTSVADEAPLHLDPLTPQHEVRVRKDKHSRDPVPP